MSGCRYLAQGSQSGQQECLAIQKSSDHETTLIIDGASEGLIELTNLTESRPKKSDAMLSSRRCSKSNQIQLMTKYQFRWLVALSLILGILSGVLDLMAPSLLPEAVRTAQDQHWAQMSTFELITSASLLLAAVVFMLATYGLFFFKKWGPSLSVTATLLGVLAVVVSPFALFSGPAFGLLDLSSYTWGAAVVVCHIEPYKGWFRSEST